MAQVAEQESGDILPGDDTGTVIRAAEICNPFLDAVEEITLRLRGSVPACILNWNSSCFSPLVRPLLSSVCRQYSLGGSLEIMELDCQFDRMLSAESRMTSRSEGRRLILGLLPPQGDRLITRYREAVRDGDTPGHLAVVHALRGGLFSLPPGILSASYLLQEGIGAGLDSVEIGRYLLGGVAGADPFAMGSSFSA
jgi:hypothetical protein